jgi:multimeric flavodoxin WrbA/putative sterol carrier protein
MRILAVNGSPRGRESNTDRILQPFLEGARQAGAEIEVIYLKEKKINQCNGCFTCWTKTPGVCVHKDDMPELLLKMRRADLIVYATPLYVFTMSGLMKNFVDRCALPLLLPDIIKRGEQYLHPVRYPEEYPKKVVLISNCGFPERHHFTGLVETFRCLTSSPDLNLVGTILCAGGELLKVPQAQESIRWYIEAAQNAGRELVEQGCIVPETQKLLDTNLVDPELYSRMANAYWGNEIPAINSEPAEGLAAAETLSAELPLSQGGDGKPRTFRDVITGQAARFNPVAAGDLSADIQFRVSGPEPGDYVLRIDRGKCSVHKGTVPAPTLTIHTPSEVWLQIARGELSGQAAYFKGMYRTEGDLGLLLRMNEIFSGQSDSTG